MPEQNDSTADAHFSQYANQDPADTLPVLEERSRLQTKLALGAVHVEVSDDGFVEMRSLPGQIQTRKILLSFMESILEAKAMAEAGLKIDAEHKDVSTDILRFLIQVRLSGKRVIFRNLTDHDRQMLEATKCQSFFEEEAQALSTLRYEQ